MSRWRRVVSPVIAVLLAFPALKAQGLLQTDSTIRTGALPNGLTYLLLENVRQRDRVALTLAVKAGRIDEADDQRGVAHLLEHMAFDGSTHFRRGEIFSYFQSVGARAGQHVNAATAIDYTTYRLDFPTGSDASIARAFDAMRDIAGGLTLDAGEYDRERRVVGEEWRRGLIAAERQRRSQYLALFGGTPYADRDSVGDPQQLATISLARVRDFYRDHYRADRMALVVVGGADLRSMEARLHASFDDLPARPASPRELPAGPEHQDTRYVAFADPESQSATVAVVFTRPRAPLRTTDDLRRDLLETLATRLLGERFIALAQRPAAPFLGVQSVRGPLLLGAESLGFTASTRPGQGGVALTSLLQEIARAREHGFTPEELNRVRLEVLTGLQRVPADNASISALLVGRYLRGEPSPSPMAQFLAASPILTAATPDDVQAVAREIWSDSNRVVMSTGSDAAGAEAVLRDTVRVVAASPILPPWQPAPAVTANAARALPPPGSVATRREDRDVGVTVLTMSNGAEVWLKPTFFNGGEVRFRAVARGGASLADPADFPQAMLAPQFVAAAGVGGLSPDERNRAQAGKQIQVLPTIAATSHGLIGTTRAPDLEAALALAHLHFTAPNRDAVALARVKSLVQNGLANQDNSPAFAFASRLNAINTGGFYMLRPRRASDIAGVEPDASLAFYVDRFGNAANFTFLFAGSFTVDGIVPLLEKYIGSLPSAGRADVVPEPPEPAFPAAVVRETVRKGRDPRSQTAITFFADTGLDVREVERANAIALILQTRLFARLRESLGATYTPTATYRDIAPQRGFGTITVTFGSAPENAERLTVEALAETARLRRDGPTADEVATVKATRAADVKTRLSRNDYWVDAMVKARLQGSGPSAVLSDVAAMDAALTVADLQEAARRYLPEARYTVVTLLPEGQ